MAKQSALERQIEELEGLRALMRPGAGGRRVVTAVAGAVAAVLVLLLAACSGGDDDPAGAARSEDDLARSLLLTVQDLPTGWSSKADDGGSIDCSLRPSGATGIAQTGTFSSSGGSEEIAQMVVVYADADTAADSGRVIEDYADCVVEAINAGKGNSDEGDLTDASRGEVSFPAFGERSKLTRVSFTVKVKGNSGPGGEVKGYLDILWIQSGRFMTAISAVDAVSPLLPSEFEAVARPAAAKLAGAQTSAAPTAASPSPSPSPESSRTASPSATARTTPTPSPTPAPQLVNQNFAFATQTDYDGKIRHDWYVLIQNPTSKAAGNAKVQALFYSADNVLLGTDDEYASVWKGKESAVAGSVSFATAAVRMEVRMPTNTTFVDVQTDAFPEVTEVAFSRDRFSGEVTGTAVNPWATTVEGMRVTCLLFDASGAFVGQDFEFLDIFPAGQTVAVGCGYISSDVAGRVATAKVYLSLSIISRVVP